MILNALKVIKKKKAKKVSKKFGLQHRRSSNVQRMKDTKKIKWSFAWSFSNSHIPTFPNLHILKICK
jgi:hypothetical protein